jgi:hypothetical protein
MVRLFVWVATLGGAATWLWSDLSWSSAPEGQVMTVVRVVAAALATWLVVVTVLAIAGRFLRVRWLGSLAPSMVRRLVAGSLAGGLLVAPGVAVAEGPPGDAPVLELVEPAPAVEPAPEGQPAAPAPVVPAGDAPPDVHVVEPGDHLWRIATIALTERLGREPSDAEVVPYWRRLIDDNRRVIGRDPDLIQPGMRIDLPS